MGIKPSPNLLLLLLVAICPPQVWAQQKDTDPPYVGLPTIPTTASTQITTTTLSRSPSSTSSSTTATPLSSDPTTYSSTEISIPTTSIQYVSMFSLRPRTPPPILSGRCSSIVKDGEMIMNKCVHVDKKAICSEDETEPTCTCSEGFSGSLCEIAAKQLEALEKLMGGGEGSVEEAQQMLKEIASSKGKGGPATIISSLPSLLSFLTDEQRVEMSYEAQDLIKGAMYEGQPLDIKVDFIRVNDPSLGNCFAFNHHNASHKYKIRRLGEGEGLIVELDAVPAEYAPWTDVVGTSVFVHSIGQEVTSAKFVSIPGAADQLIISKAVHNRIGKNCARDTSAAQSFYMSGTYSVDGCLRACYQDSVHLQCGCMDAIYARRRGVGACGFGKLPCISTMMETRGDISSWPECRCAQPCSEESFEYKVSSAAYLSPRNTNETRRVSQVSIYFESFENRVTTEAYKISLTQLLGNIGGVAGLMLGMSAIFVVEAIMLGIAIVIKGCCR